VVEFLDLEGLHIAGDLDLSYLRWSGRLNLRHCRVTGSVILSYASIQGMVCLDGSTVDEVEAVDATVNGSFYLRDGFAAARGLRGLGLTVTGALSVTWAKLGVPLDKPGRAALDICRASVGDLSVTSARLNGGLYADGATIGRNIRLQDARIRSRASLGLEHNGEAGGGVNLVDVHAGGSITLWSAKRPGFELKGSVNLDGATCQELVVNPKQLRDLLLRVDDFNYTRLRPATGEDMFAMLDRIDLSPGGYGQLAALFERQGEPERGRAARIRVQWRLAQKYSRWSWEGMRRRALGFFVGYGYRPSRALAGLAGCLVVSTVLIAVHPSLFQPNGSGPAHLSFIQAVGLAVDNVVPLISTGLSGQWTLNADQWPWFTALLVLKLAGWALTLLAAAAVTGLIRDR
jgi:hypothetical protein